MNSKDPIAADCGRWRILSVENAANLLIFGHFWLRMRRFAAGARDGPVASLSGRGRAC